MNFVLPEFDEELYESLYENIAVNNGKRYKSEDKNKFISNLTNYLKTNSHLFDAKRVTEGDNTNNYLLSYDNDLSSKVIFSAHYDTVKNTPGFNDNSSGLILSMMFLLKCNIPVLLTDGEEAKCRNLLKICRIYQRSKEAYRGLLGPVKLTNLLGLKGSEEICRRKLFKDKVIIVLDSVGIGEYLVYNCSDNYKELLDSMKHNIGIEYKDSCFFATDGQNFKDNKYDVISLSRSSSLKRGKFHGMHLPCDKEIEQDKINEMYCLICKILEKLNLIPAENMEKV